MRKNLLLLSPSIFNIDIYPDLISRPISEDIKRPTACPDPVSSIFSLAPTELQKNAEFRMVYKQTIEVTVRNNKFQGPIIYFFPWSVRQNVAIKRAQVCEACSLRKFTCEQIFGFFSALLTERNLKHFDIGRLNILHPRSH